MSVVATLGPPPRPGITDVTELVIADIRARSDAGLKKYGTRLQTHNGRDALMDAYQEALDLVAYLRQVIEERGSLYEVLPADPEGRWLIPLGSADPREWEWLPDGKER